MPKKRILVTGAGGSIGKNLVEYLKVRYHLFATTHSDLELFDEEKVKLFIINNKIDVIVNCASVGGSRKTAYDVGKIDVIEKNLRIFCNLERCLNSVKRMIFLGSGAEYDVCHYKPRMKEGYFDTYVPKDAYGFSKYLCSKYIMGSKKIVNLRLFGVFGKYEDYEFKFISNVIVKNLFGLPIVINQNVTFSYLYVNDLVRIIEYFINHKVKYKFYNIVPNETIDLLTIVRKINEISDKPSKIIVKNPGSNVEYSGDNKRLRREMGKFKFTPIDEALKELYLWYKSNFDKIDKKAIFEDRYIKYCRTKKCDE